MESDKKIVEKPKNPRASANILSALTFSWTLPYFSEGYRRDLDLRDLFDPLKEHSSNYLGDKFERAWEDELSRSAKAKREPSFLRVIIRVFGCSLALYGIILFVTEIILRVLQPFLLGGLIDYFAPNNVNRTQVTEFEAYTYAVGIIACSGITVFSMHPYMMAIMHIGMKVRIASCSLLYRKALRLSKTALGQTTVGQVVNLLSNDVSRFDIAFIFIHNLWIGPLQTCIVTYFLWDQIEYASIIGLLSLLMLIPFQAWLGKAASSFRLKTAMRTDERVRLMNEIITGIQVIKMYTWEKPFAYLVSKARRKEINVVRKASYIKGVMLSFIIFHTRTSVFCSILAYILLGGKINAQKVFIVMSFYNTLRQTMTIYFPSGITQAAEGYVSVKRIQKFLLYDETTNPDAFINNEFKGKEKNVNEFISSTEKKSHKESSEEINEIILENATARWTHEQSEHTLNNICLNVSPGKLTAVIGPVGAGKTSLLHVILKELPLLSGSLKVKGTISYASQEPWLFAGSVKQNILFGEPLNKGRYHQVVKACALKADFDQFPLGDKTIVGERGVSLSGGQRARINLARAIYKNADIYLLDDPLSAVDTHVGRHLFEDCVTGFLKKKTVILITHQLQFLNSVDHIILLDSGSLTAQGTYAELKNSGLDFAELLAGHIHIEKDEESAVLIGQPYSRQTSMQSVASSFEDNHHDDPVEVAETQAKGAVTSAVYKSYLLAGGGCFLLFIMLFLCFFAQFLASGGDYWITYWVNLEEYYYQSNSTEKESYLSTHFFVPSREECIYIFAALTIGTIIFTLVRSFLFFFMCMRASITLHNRMFDSITHATMWFFNNNSTGRILNRFAKDMGSIDEILPAAFVDCLQIGITLLAIVIVVAIMNVWLLVPTIMAGILFYHLRNFFLSTSRSVKRLEGITRSPVFTHLNASIQGLTTIRAFRAQAILEKEFDNHQDLHSSAWYLFLSSSRAFGLWLDIVCLVYIALVTLSFLVLGGETYGGNVGLAITQSIGLTGMLQWGIRQSAEVENLMTSVERVLEYTSLESEPPLESPPDKKPKESWPHLGKIVFCKVFLRYGSTDQWILKNVHFTIEPKQKVGIVGRTGAGKSSLISALFRLTEIQGSIYIDDIDTSSIGLHELRSKVSIIPQEPVLFSGTMRKNLDPFDQYQDELLWSALEEVELKEVVGELVGGLNAKISEGGTNMSVGQRQLVCLARAIIRNNKILVLDEATANVDPKTDSLIQRTIRRKFADCTVLTIAHRLNTVMDSDKVLVMDSGINVEFDHPHLLLQNNEGFLYKMVEQTGRATAETLRKIAAENFERLTTFGKDVSSE